MGVGDEEEIDEKLNNWEESLDCLAPISDNQRKGIDILCTHANRKITALEENKVTPEREICEDDELQPITKIDNSQQFLFWFSRLEESMLEDEDSISRNYAEDLGHYHGQCTHLLDEIYTSLTQLDALHAQYQFVSAKTNALHDACEHLLAEQAKLVNAAENIGEKLSYFVEIDVLTQKLSSPTLSVLHESFVPVLARLDECISYLEANSQYKESGTYLLRFRHLQSSALGMIRSYVVNSFQQLGQHSVVKEESGFTLFYGKFRTNAPRIRSLMEQIEDRVDWDPSGYRQLLEDCHQCYFTQRDMLLGPSVSASISELAAGAHKRDHCAMVRSGCILLVHLCQDEHQLFHQFFGHTSDQLDTFLERLCQRLYDVLRPVIIHVVHLETLAELCTILKVEMLEEQVQNNYLQLRAFEKVCRQALEDVQERLVYRSQIYIQTDILGYCPAPGDLAYPEKLEMMESIAESLTLNAGTPPSRSNSRSSGEPATLAVSSSEHTASKSECTVQSTVDPSDVIIPPKPSLHYSPADLHGMWYPTVRRTLVCLSKLYRCLDRSIFQGLSQEVLSACIQSLTDAGMTISSSKSTLDGLLFRIKHLLILREQIAPFQVDFAIKETSLDFSRVRAAAYSLLQKKSRMFALNTTNSLLEFLLEGTPQVTQLLVDSKKAVDTQLKVVCEEFISHASEQLLGPLAPFLDKVKVIQKAGEANERVSLRNQPFAGPDQVAQTVTESYRNLKTKLSPLQRSMALYLANRDTEYILFRPVRIQIQSAYESLIQLVKTNYGEEEQLVIGCPSLEQVQLEFLVKVPSVLFKNAFDSLIIDSCEVK